MSLLQTKANSKKQNKSNQTDFTRQQFISLLTTIYEFKVDPLETHGIAPAVPIKWCFVFVHFSQEDVFFTSFH